MSQRNPDGSDAGTGQAGGSTGGPSVLLAGGEDASGMATMLAELLTDNLRDYPGRARVARVVRGPVVMTASDRDRSVTVRFSGGEIGIEDGAVDGAPCVVGEWLDLAQLCSGRLSPVQAVTQGRLALHHLRRLDLLAAAGFVLSVPASYYGEVSFWVRWRIAIAVVAVALLVAAIAATWRRR